MSWKTYTDTRFKFSISYPPDFVSWVSATPADKQPQPLTAVRFLEEKLARSETAELQVPNAQVEVYRLAPETTLESWLVAHEPDATRTKIVVGGLEGYRTTRMILIAPNQSVWFTDGTSVFRLTFLGEHGTQMLESFRLIG